MIKNRLPIHPFNGQLFIDKFGIKWVYNTFTGYWLAMETVNAIPPATKTYAGMMIPHQLSILESANDGNFALILDTKLVNRKLQPTPIFIGTAHLLVSDIYEYKLFIYETLEIDKYVGMTLFANEESSLILGNENNFFSLDSEINIKDGDSYSIIDTREYNKQGFIYGDLKFVSDSIEMENIMSVGSSEDHCYNEQNIISMSLNDDFKESYCLVIPGIKGSRGKTGPDGNKGIDGYDRTGPKGKKGEDGKDGNETLSELYQINIIDIDDISDEILVKLELDKNNGKLYAVTSDININDENADKVIVKQTFRDLELDWDGKKYMRFKILNEKDQEIIDDRIAIMRSEPISNQYNSINCASLREFIQIMIDYYSLQYTSATKQIYKNIVEYVGEKNKQAREILANLARRLTDCQWSSPLDFSKKISQSFCFATSDNLVDTSPNPSPPGGHGGDGGDGGAGGAGGAGGSASASVFMSVAINNDKIPPNTPEEFIKLEGITDSVELPANFARPITKDGSSTMGAGTYVVTHKGGSYSNQNGQNFVGGVGDRGITITAIDNQGNVDTTDIPSLGSEGMSAADIQAAYRNADISQNSAVVNLNEEGSILVESNAGVDGSGVVQLSVIKLIVEDC